MNIQRVSDRRELPAVYAVYKSLRPHLSYDAFCAQVERQQMQYFQIATLEDEGRIVAVAGYRFAEFLAWGKVLYIDDFVTLPGATRRKEMNAFYVYLADE